MLAKILDTLPIGIMLVDDNLRVRYCNTALVGLTGYSQEEAKGVGAEFILRSNVGAGSHLAQDTAKTGVTCSLEGTLLNRTRRNLPVRFTLSRINKGGIQVMIAVEEKDVDAEERVLHLSTNMVGNSPRMQKVFDSIKIFARTDASVLITGETGCGKDLLAEELHNNSQRAKRAFIKVNCGALPEALLESELFGHKRGAFTGAVNDHLGMFRLADKGTLFLTEIGDLSLPLQVKLLSVLDDRKFFPVGSTEQVSVDVRVIAATHRNLREEVRLGHFREDLFFRLNVLHLEIPPLRKRDDDMRLLLEHFLRQSIVRSEVRVKRFSKESLALLYDYRWPGNVRELRNVVEYAVNICRSDVVEPADLPEYIISNNEIDDNAAENGREIEENFPSTFSMEEKKQRSWTVLEREKILHALEQANGRKAKAAKILGIGRTTLWRKIKNYGLDR